MQNIGPKNEPSHDPEPIEYEIEELLKTSLPRKRRGLKILSLATALLCIILISGASAIWLYDQYRVAGLPADYASNFPKTWQTYWCPVNMTDAEAWVAQVSSNEIAFNEGGVCKVIRVEDRDRWTRISCRYLADDNEKTVQIEMARADQDGLIFQAVNPEDFDWIPRRLARCSGPNSAASAQAKPLPATPKAPEPAKPATSRTNSSTAVVSSCNEDSVKETILNGTIGLFKQRMAAVSEGARPGSPVLSYQNSINRWSAIIENVVQSQYDEVNNIRYCEARVVHFSPPDFTSLSILFMAGGIDVKRSDLCHGSVTYKIQRVLDKPGSENISWRCS